MTCDLWLYILSLSLSFPLALFSWVGYNHGKSDRQASDSSMELHNIRFALKQLFCKRNHKKYKLLEHPVRSNIIRLSEVMICASFKQPCKNIKAWSWVVPTFKRNPCDICKLLPLWANAEAASVLKLLANQLVMLQKLRLISQHLAEREEARQWLQDSS